MAIELQPVDRVEITVLVDNTIDILMSSTPVARRAPTRKSWADEHQLRAEHGLSILVRAYWDGAQGSVLLDAGPTVEGAVHNLDAVGGWPNDLEAIVVSHGHTDHTGGLVRVVERLDRPGLPIYLHPHALRRRKNVRGAEESVHVQIDAGRLRALGANLIVRAEPSLLLDGHLLLTGQIDRTTDFERGAPTQFAEIDGEWQPDPWTWDDQALVACVREKGLVVITGCGHAGVVNTLRHAQSLADGKPIHSLLGGFHLTGNIFDPIVEPTVAALQDLAPRYVVPMHCTGFKATHRLAATMPEAFVPSSVGTTFVF